MALTFLLDGYNIIHSTDWLSVQSIDAQREGLCRFIETRNPAGGSANKIIIVFDGKPGRHKPDERAGISVRFSYEKDADTVIKNWVDAAKNPAAIVVVTNDKAIQRWVRGAKAKVSTCEQFLSRGIKRKLAPGQKSIDPDSAQDLMSELKKKWL